MNAVAVETLNHAAARMRLEEWPVLPLRRALHAGRDWRIVQPGLPHAVDDRAMESTAGAEVLESDERGSCDGAAENHRLLRSPSNSARISLNGTLGSSTGDLRVKHALLQFRSHLLPLNAHRHTDLRTFWHFPISTELLIAPIYRYRSARPRRATSTNASSLSSCASRRTWCPSSPVICGTSAVVRGALPLLVWRTSMRTTVVFNLAHLAFRSYSISGDVDSRALPCDTSIQ